MKKYLLVNEYEYIHPDKKEEFKHKEYTVVNAKSPKEAVLIQEDRVKTDKRYERLNKLGVLNKRTVDIREMIGNDTVGDNLIYDD